MVKRFGMMVMTLALAFALALGVGVAYGSTGPATVQGSYAQPGLLTVDDGSVPLTGIYTSYARYIAGYSLMDYGGQIVIPTLQTVTAKIQFSPNGTTWFDVVTVHNASVAGTTVVTPAQTTAEFTYARMIYTPISLTAQYTPSMWLMFK